MVAIVSVKSICFAIARWI